MTFLSFLIHIMHGFETSLYPVLVILTQHIRGHRTVSPDHQQKQVHATNATYERADPLSLFHSFVFIWFFFFGSAVVLDLDLPEGEGRKTALGEAPRNRCRPASALCPDMARGENQMSTSTDNNAYCISHHENRELVSRSMSDLES